MSVAMAQNAVLKRLVEPLMKQVRRLSTQSGEDRTPVRAVPLRRGQLESRAAGVIFKAEVVRLGDREPRDNARFVVTNLRRVPQRGVRGGSTASWANIEKPHQGAAVRSVDRSHQLHEFSGPTRCAHCSRPPPMC